MSKKPVPVVIEPTPWKAPPEPKLKPGSPFKRPVDHNADGFAYQRMDPPPVRNDCSIADVMNGRSAWGGNNRPEQDTQRFRDAGNQPELPAVKEERLPVVSLKAGR